jgi:hypothetical protein
MDRGCAQRLIVLLEYLVLPGLLVLHIESRWEAAACQEGVHVDKFATTKQKQSKQNKKEKRKRN